MFSVGFWLYDIVNEDKAFELQWLVAQDDVEHVLALLIFFIESVYIGCCFNMPIKSALVPQEIKTKSKYIHDLRKKILKKPNKKKHWKLCNQISLHSNIICGQMNNTLEFVRLHGYTYTAFAC